MGKTSPGRPRLALLGHCILNQNARAPGKALHRGVITPLLEILDEGHYELMQLPCPETSFTGVARWWFVYEQYDSVNYRRHCSKLAKATTALLKPYSDKGYDVVVVGLGISPSCGIRMRLTNKAWRGRPYDVGEAASVEQGKGVWIQELEKAMKKGGVKFRMLDVPPVLLYPPGRVPLVPEYPAAEADAWKEMREFLGV